MARVFVTGSSTGLGLMAGELLVEQGHRVVLHARNQSRADDARRALPQAEAVVLGDLSSVAGARSVADEANSSAGSTRSSTTPASAMAAAPSRRKTDFRTSSPSTSSRLMS